MVGNRWRRLVASPIVLVVAFVGLGLGSSAAQAYCNQAHQAWDPCYDVQKMKPPQAEADRPLAHAACDDLDLHVTAAIGTQTCRAANVSDADAHGRAEIVSAEGAGAFFFAEYLQAGVRTYIIRLQPGDVVDQTDLKPSVSGWEPQIEIQGFDVRRFRAGVGAGTAHCAAFTKHWGHMPQTTGYRHRIAGIYCSGRGSDTADDRLTLLLGSIEPSE